MIKKGSERNSDLKIGGREYRQFSFKIFGSWIRWVCFLAEILLFRTWNISELLSATFFGVCRKNETQCREKFVFFRCSWYFRENHYPATMQFVNWAFSQVFLAHFRLFRNFSVITEKIVAKILKGLDLQPTYSPRIVSGEHVIARNSQSKASENHWQGFWTACSARARR